MDGLTDPFRALPDEAPLAMPVQVLAEAPPGGRGRVATTPPGLALRRVAVVGGAAAIGAFGTFEMNRVLNGDGATALGVLVVALFAVLFCWISLAFTSALGGLASVLSGGGLGLGLACEGPLPRPGARTALLMPTYNEDPSRVVSALQAMVEDLVRLDRLESFDVFILSDTTDPAVWIAEEAALLDLRARLGEAGARVFYRRRSRNIERKAGNVGEWVRRFGGAYPQMVTLDADSVMSGEVLVRLADALERNPAVGLIQTLPVIVNGTTLFARMQQFAGRVYGPLIAHGIAWWHGSEGNYWGHNAIIRTRAFAGAAGLPHLPGRRPFGGHVLSHDFVEAALMRRAGWAIHMVPALAGSFEESPPSLTDIAIRDRRWCQGNLQHGKVVRARGLHWVSRAHMLMGIGSYVTSPLWLAFLLAGILISLQARFARPSYFGAGRSLFPRWPDVDPVLAKWVFVGTMAILLAPKLFAFLALLADRRTRIACGGAARVAGSILLETLVGGLIAPVAMLLQTGAVVSILAGRDSGWNAQRRDDGSIPMAQVWARYRWHTLFGVLLAAAAWLVSLPLMLWMLPVLLGLVLAVPLVGLTASRASGEAARRIGLLSIPEERSVPPVLARANALAAARRAAAPPALRDLLTDNPLSRAHRAMLPKARARGDGAPDADLLTGLARLDDHETLEAALAVLTRGELVALQSSPSGLDRMRILAGAPDGRHDGS